MGEVASRGKPKLCGISIGVPGAEDGKAMSSVWPTAHEGVESNGLRGNAGKDIKGVSRDNIREVRDYSNAVPGIGSLVSRGVNRQGSMGKSRGRFRT